MNKIGFYREYTRDLADISVLSLKDGDKQDISDQVLNYLKNGYFVEGQRESFTCPLTGRVIIPNIIYTDGVWIWTTGLIFYVENFNIALPDEFLNHMHINKYKNPPKEQIDKIIDLIYDELY